MVLTPYEVTYGSSIKDSFSKFIESSFLEKMVRKFVLIVRCFVIIFQTFLL